MIIPILDTHRLPYVKGKFTATRLGPGNTTPVNFYDSDGNNLGLEIFTNSEGFVCDSNGNLLGNGVFVHVDSVISGHYNGGRFVQWVALGQNDNVQVNDGKLLNENGDVIFSANAAFNHTLNWNDLAGKPKLNAWSENEQDVIIDTLTSIDSVVVNNFTKVLVVNYADSLPEIEVANLKLKPQTEGEQRFGQVIFVQVIPYKAKALQLWNEGDTAPFCVVHGSGSAMISLLSNGKFEVLSVFENNADIARVETTGNSTYNISDSTCTVLQIYGTPTQSLTERDPNGIAYLNLRNGGLSKSRRIVLWWQPSAENSKYVCRVQTTDNGQTLNVCDLYPYKPVELVCYPGQDNALGLVVLGTVEQTTPFYAEVELSQNDASASSDIKSNQVALPTACTMARLAWDTGSLHILEGTPPSLTAIVKVPPNWKGEVILVGGDELVDLLGESFTMYVAIYCGYSGADKAYLTSDVNRDADLSGQRIMVCSGEKFMVKVHIESGNTGGVALAFNPMSAL